MPLPLNDLLNRAQEWYSHLRSRLNRAAKDTRNNTIKTDIHFFQLQLLYSAVITSNKSSRTVYLSMCSAERYMEISMYFSALHMLRYMEISMYLNMSNAAGYMEISMYLSMCSAERYMEISMYLNFGTLQQGTWKFPCTSACVVQKAKVHGNFHVP